MLCREEDAAIPPYCKDDERQSAQKMPPKAGPYCSLTVYTNIEVIMRLTTSGESHGKGLFAILEGVPAGLTLDLSRIDGALALRQSG